MKIPQFLALVLLYFCTNQEGLSQEYSYNFSNYTVSDGLPSSQIYQIIQDRNGYIWFGTDRGLVRFDGKRFQVFTIEDGLGSNCIFYLAEAIDGGIWTYGKSGAISRYHNGTIKSIKVSVNGAISHVQSIMVEPSYLKVFVSTRSHILDTALSSIRLNIDGTQEKKFLKQGTLHLGLEKGNIESVYNNKIDTVVIDHKNKFSFLKRLAAVNTTSRACTKNGISYFNLENTVYRADSTGIAPLGTLENRVLDLEINSKNQLMVGTTHGLWIVSNAAFENKTQMLEKYHISSIFEDKNGGLWLGSLFNGLFYLPKNYSEHLNVEDRSAIIQCEGNSSGLVFVSQNKTFFSEINNRTTPIFKLERSRTVFGLQTYRENEFINFSPMSSSYIFNLERKMIKIDGFNQMVKNRAVPYLLLPTQQGFTGSKLNYILKFDKNFVLTDKIDCNSQIHSICYGGKDSIILGTQKGVQLFYEDEFHPYFDQYSFFKSPINDHIKLNDSTYIFASQKKGVLIQINDTISYHLTKANGLLSNNIEQILASKKCLFAASKKGINLIYPNGLVRQLTKKNGLSSNEVNDLFYRNDTLWVATFEGMDRIDLSRNQTNDFQEIVLSNFKTDQKKQEISRSYFVEYATDEIDFSIDFLDYELRQDVQFKYRLAGHEKHWNYRNESVLHYSKLAPGDYTFEIAYQNANGLWSPITQLFDLKKAKPFWQMPLFIIGVFLFLGLCTWLLIRSRYNQIRKEELAKYNLLDLERQALQSQMNPHFIFNAMTSIQSLILEKETDAAIEYLVRFAKLTRLALNHSTEAYVPIENEIQLIENYAEIEQMRFSNKFEYTISLEDHLNYFQIPPMLIQPFVENAILHGFEMQDGGGLLHVSFERNTQNTLVCTIDDNGSGRKINPRKIQKSMGVRLIVDRLNLLLPEVVEPVTYTDKTDGNNQSRGTTVKIIIPIQK